MKNCNLHYMLNERLKLALDEAGLNAFKLSKKVGVSHVAVGQWLKGESINIKGATALKVADALGVNAEWLLTGLGPMRGSGVTVIPTNKTPNQNYVVIPLHKLKCITQEDNTMISFEAISGPSEVYTKDFFDLFKADPKHCFRCRIENDNMEPVLKENDIVLINSSDKDIRSNKLYAISNQGQFEVYRIIKQLDGKLILKSENKNYSDISTTKEELESNNIFIVGKVLVGTVFF